MRLPHAILKPQGLKLCVGKALVGALSEQLGRLGVDSWTLN